MANNDLKHSRERVDQLNEQIAAEKVKLAQIEQSASDGVRQVTLDNEARRLTEELNALKARTREAQSVVKKPTDVVQPTLEEGSK